MVDIFLSWQMRSILKNETGIESWIKTKVSTFVTYFLFKKKGDKNKLISIILVLIMIQMLCKNLISILC